MALYGDLEISLGKYTNRMRRDFMKMAMNMQDTSDKGQLVDVAYDIAAQFITSLKKGDKFYSAQNSDDQKQIAQELLNMSVDESKSLFQDIFANVQHDEMVRDFMQSILLPEKKIEKEPENTNSQS